MKRATVVDGRMPHALLLEMFTTEGTGTMVVPADQSREAHSMTTHTEELAARWSAVMMSNYRTPPVALDRGDGATVWDVDGREYTDLLGGIATTILGHAHPKVVEAITAQAQKLGHVSNLAMHEPGAAARRAAARPGRPAGPRLLLQLRRRGQRGGVQDQPADRAARGGHRRGLLPRPDHGRAGPHRPAGEGRRRSRRCPAACGSCRTGTPRRWPAAVGEQTAMVLLEPMLGEGGVLPAPPGYLAAAAATAADAGALFAVDEVQTGIGRTGSWFMHQADGVAPDVITLAKALGGGLPMGALLAFGDGGRPADRRLATARRSAATRSPRPPRSRCSTRSATRGCWSGRRSSSTGSPPASRALGHPGISGVRGRGALLGVVLTADVAGALEADLRAAGFLTNAVAPGVLRLAPPLVLTDAQVDAFVARPARRPRRRRWRRHQ